MWLCEDVRLNVLTIWGIQRSDDKSTSTANSFVPRSMTRSRWKLYSWLHRVWWFFHKSPARFCQREINRHDLWTLYLIHCTTSAYLLVREYDVLYDILHCSKGSHCYIVAPVSIVSSVVNSTIVLSNRWCWLAFKWHSFLLTGGYVMKNDR